MKKIGTRSWVRGLCVVAVLAVVAIPLWNLMVAQAPIEMASDDVVTATVSVSELSTTEPSETSSAVSALMAGSAVGPTRGAEIRLRNPATAFAP